METKKHQSIPSDLELLTTASIGDVERIASKASRADLIAAIRWCDSRLALNHARRVTLCDALRKKGDAK